MSTDRLPDLAISKETTARLIGRGLKTLPRFVQARINYPSPQIDPIPAVISDALESIDYSTLIKPGGKIAIAVGSRGIAELQTLVSILIQKVREFGAEPFIVPAMGSHGQATGKGQEQLLRGLGITPEAMGATILSSMKVDYLGKTKENVPVYIDSAAFHSDGIILVNRIREHTDFEGPIQSGLMKMLSIGLGKARGASAIHARGAANLPVNIPAVAKFIIAKAPVLFGLGVVENGDNKLAALRCARPEFFESLDQELLILARKWTPRLPVDTLDVLVVRSIGKEISGTGMDTKTVGRIRIPGVSEPEKPKIQRIVALDLTSESQGNATGLALADFITQRLYSKIDFKAFYLNQLAAAHFEGGKIPMVMATDRDALEVAMCLGWIIKPNKLRSIIIPDTKHLSNVLVSEALVTELEKLDHVIVSKDFINLTFDQDGTLLN